jgi:hypothetical protein
MGVRPPVTRRDLEFMVLVALPGCAPLRGPAVSLAAKDLRQHFYLVGQTGTGKSTFLRTLTLADAAAGVPSSSSTRMSISV